MYRMDVFIENSFQTYLTPIVMQNAPNALSIVCESNRWP